MNRKHSWTCGAGVLGTLLLALTLAACRHIAAPAANEEAARHEYELGRRFAQGDGVPQDYSQAAEHYQRAARLGSAPAQTELGTCYARGLGVEKNLPEAVHWFREAAAQQDALAEYSLGYAYAHGAGVPPDLNVALHWWQRSATHGQPEAANALGQFYLKGGDREDANQMDYASAARWLRQAAQQDYVPAMNNLGFLYQFGFGVPRDYDQALHWYRRAAEHGEARAQANLGVLYQDGSGVPSDLVEAYKWFTLSAQQGDVVGRHFRDEYDRLQRLTPPQLAEARRRVDEFLTSRPCAAELAPASPSRGAD